jgi:hypothetical protein
MQASESYASVPDWFSGKLKACKASIPGPLLYKEKYCEQFYEMSCAKFATRDLTIPDSTEYYELIPKSSISNPGLGKCCVFDENGKILKSEFATEGNDGCDALMKKTPNAAHYGIWWFVYRYKDTDHLQWWHGSK